jgi:hypothetical protein
MNSYPGLIIGFGITGAHLAWLVRKPGVKAPTGVRGPQAFWGVLEDRIVWRLKKTKYRPFPPGRYCEEPCRPQLHIFRAWRKDLWISRYIHYVQSQQSFPLSSAAGTGSDQLSCSNFPVKSRQKQNATDRIISSTST